MSEVTFVEFRYGAKVRSASGARGSCTADGENHATLRSSTCPLCVGVVACGVCREWWREPIQGLRDVDVEMGGGFVPVLGGRERSRGLVALLGADRGGGQREYNQ